MAFFTAGVEIGNISTDLVVAEFISSLTSLATTGDDPSSSCVVEALVTDADEITGGNDISNAWNVVPVNMLAFVNITTWTPAFISEIATLSAWEGFAGLEDIFDEKFQY